MKPLRIRATVGPSRVATSRINNFAHLPDRPFWSIDAIDLSVVLVIHTTQLHTYTNITDIDIFNSTNINTDKTNNIL